MKSITRTASLTVLGVIVTGAGVVAGLELSNTTHWFHDKPVAAVKLSNGETANVDSSVPGSADKASAGGPVNSRGTGQPTADTGDDDSLSMENQPGQIDPGVTPKKPFGQFVSNHYPASVNETETSVCTTTPGAKCQIIFAKESTKKSLTALVTNGEGSVSWNWTPKSAGLTSGKWQVTAVATNGSKSVSQTDQVLLEVK